MYRNRIDLCPYGLEANKEFMRSMHNSYLDGKKIIFDFLDCSISFQRQQDKEMDTEKFVLLMDSGIGNASLEIGTFYLGIKDDIRHFVIIDGYGKARHRKKDRFAWLTCDYTQKNIDIISGLFSQAFGLELTEVKIPEFLVPYFEKKREEAGY